jgi:hypothetical protein
VIEEIERLASKLQRLAFRRADTGIWAATFSMDPD